MNHPSLESAIPFQNSTNGLGYQIDSSEAYIRKAISQAVDMLNRVRWIGAETRVWANHAEVDTKQKLEKMKLTANMNKNPVIQRMKIASVVYPSGAYYHSATMICVQNLLKDQI